MLDNACQVYWWEATVLIRKCLLAVAVTLFSASYAPMLYLSSLLLIVARIALFVLFCALSFGRQICSNSSTRSQLAEVALLLSGPGTVLLLDGLGLNLIGDPNMFLKRPILGISCSHDMPLPTFLHR